MRRMALDNDLFLSLLYLTGKLSGVNRILAKVTSVTDLQNFYHKCRELQWQGS